MATNYNPEAIKKSADKLGSIMDDMSAFDALKPNWPNAGKFPLAQWLERVVDDRRNGLVAQGEHLKTVLTDLKSTLVSITDDFQNTDGDNAAKIKQSIVDIEKRASDDVAKFDQGTEAQQGNFTGGPKGNASDGDGYNDNLPGSGAKA
ncbi:hypothetical protein AB5J62_24550 [Amycolatopsis sp. cg5]|uniref:hypothetical protein n=1 Tax=Amycolatopsis sp. cg5 TaxID=3238802 RepID=UPI0035244E11